MAQAENIVKVAGGRIALSWELTKDGKESTSGKSTVHLSTGGFQPIEGTDFLYNMVVIKKKK